MNKKELIKKTESFVQELFTNELTRHDWWHTFRVRVLAKKIALKEGADLFIVDMAALLHDVGDYKFFEGDEKKGLMFLKKWLFSLNMPEDLKNNILDIITHVSYKNTLPDINKETKNLDFFRDPSKEFMAVCDADRLDAIGAIGIARAFTYGGFYRRPIFDPRIRPNKAITQEEYKTTNAPSINHFYEKLLKIKNMMYTPLGKKMAKKRHRFLNLYLKEFYKEWRGKL